MDSSQPSPYGYTPSVAMGVIGTIGFCTATGFLIFQSLRTKYWLGLTLMIGALMESSGYIARLISAVELSNVTMFLVQYLAIILAPSFLAAGCYMTFGRLVWWITPKHQLNFRTLWCPPRWITPVFVSFDLLTFLVQLAGVSQVGNAFKDGVSPQDKQNDIDSGTRILKLGLGLQLVCFGVFVLVGVRFLTVSRRWRAPDGVANWRRLSTAVNGAAGLITLRATYRIFEFSGSSKTAPKDYLNTHEWPFWAFDALPILLSLMTFCIVFPSYYLPRPFYGFRLDKKRVWATKLQEVEIS